MENSPLILLVEDDPGIAKVTTLILQRGGARVVHHNNGHDALMYLQSHTPDMIITDVSMPSMSGWQFLEQMQENPAQMNIPIIVLTAYADRLNKMEARLQGVDAFLSKPATPDQLWHEIKRILRLG